MVLKIDQDQQRFKQIVRGKVRENLKKYVTHGEMIGRKGRDLISIPLPQLDVPHFRYGQNGSGGVGQGEGEVGQSLGSGEPGPGEGKAGSDPGAHILEVDVTLEELAAILGDELELPRIEPKGKANITQEKAKYTSIRRAGPESLRHFKRTYMEALRRQISSSTYDAVDPLVVPIREDKRYRSWSSIPLPQTKAVVMYMMDVSGSMTDEQKQIVRTEAFWLDTWLASQYDGLEVRYIIHDAAAQGSGRGDLLSHPRKRRHANQLRVQSVRRNDSDEIPAVRLEHLLLPVFRRRQLGRGQRAQPATAARGLVPHVNLFCYGQVESPYGSGEYIRALQGRVWHGPREDDPLRNRK